MTFDFGSLKKKEPEKKEEKKPVSVSTPTPISKPVKPRTPTPKVDLKPLEEKVDWIKKAIEEGYMAKLDIKFPDYTPKLDQVLEKLNTIPQQEHPILSPEEIQKIKLLVYTLAKNRTTQGARKVGYNSVGQLGDALIYLVEKL